MKIFTALCWYIYMTLGKEVTFPLSSELPDVPEWGMWWRGGTGWVSKLLRGDLPRPGLFGVWFWAFFIKDWNIYTPEKVSVSSAEPKPLLWPWEARKYFHPRGCRRNCSGRELSPARTRRRDPIPVATGMCRGGGDRQGRPQGSSWELSLTPAPGCAPKASGTALLFCFFPFINWVKLTREGRRS